MKFKTNVRQPAFYREANQMQAGWGTYLKKIDQLKDKVAKNQKMNIKEFCWTLYGEGHTSHCWERFQRYYIKHFGQKRVNHKIFNDLFTGWVKDSYDSHDQRPIK